jgi:hypothetical protein
MILVFLSFFLPFSLSIYTYIYIHIHTHTHTHIYIYIERERETIKVTFSPSQLHRVGGNADESAIGGLLVC